MDRPRPMTKTQVTCLVSPSSVVCHSRTPHGTHTKQGPDPGSVAFQPFIVSETLPVWV